ncbi:hypothetical protein [Vibrio splendidus]|uniref:hypothetical protein n=1 Tax=Vibrio splendidus TaxID=29497 RepID=UPI000317E48B|nr:hypothetical protein [Vibrio splendidus]OEE51652.1 hypothetical protein A146_00565 [Vibrio splendidus FF-500]
MKLTKGEPLHHYRYDDENLNFIERLVTRKKRRAEGFYQRMFNEDFSRVFRSASKKESLFNISSNDDELTKRLLAGLRSQHRYQSTDENIRTWIDDIARSLLWSQTVCYFVHDNQEENESRIVPLNSDDVFNVLGINFQLVPKRLERPWESDEELLPTEVRILETNKLIRFNICNSIGSILSRQNRTLELLDKYRDNNLQFYPQATYDDPNPRNYFDFNRWSKTQHKALHIATRETGWNARNLGESERSVYFDYYRMLRFRRNQLVFRDDILQQIGRELTRIGRQYNKMFTITISLTSVLPKVEELNDLEELFSKEKVSFKEITDYCFER